MRQLFGVADIRNPVVVFMLQAVLCGLEIFLAYTADRAFPILRDILESSAGCDSAVRITDFGIIFITTKSAYIFLHS